PGYEQIGIVVRNCESYETMAEYFTTLEDFTNDFTCNEWNVDQLSVPKKPLEDNGNMVCPNCMEIIDDEFSECENCGQALDWR
ncbi:MAG: hypothetical protein Q4D26_09795, partial [Clostridia bacterium]|nr:hypothetical protein [Clostridia bacterium]